MCLRYNQRRVSALDGIRANVIVENVAETTTTIWRKGLTGAKEEESSDEDDCGREEDKSAHLQVSETHSRVKTYER